MATARGQGKRSPDLAPRAIPSQPRGTRTRQRIIESAHQVLKEAGWSGFSMPAVARRGGVSIGAVYRLFPNKEALLCRLYEEKLALIREMTEPARLAILDAPDWRKGFENYVRALMRAEVEADFDQSLADAVHRSPEILEIDIGHAVRIADGFVGVFRNLGSTWSDAALFDLAMTLYSLDATVWLYGKIAGGGNGVLAERMIAASLAVLSPAMDGSPEPTELGMNRDDLRARFSL